MLGNSGKTFIQERILIGSIDLMWSYILEYENSRNPFEDQRKAIFQWKNIAVRTVTANDEIVVHGNLFRDRGLHPLDALHVACAYVGGSDYFLTVDKGILSKPFPEIRVCNPIDFVRELSRSEAT
jgi:hypothetical protein